MKGIHTFQQLESNNLIKELVLFMEAELKEFPVAEEFFKILKKKKNENQHTTAFCVFMNQRCRVNEKGFIFHSENPQKGASAVDIGVYYGCELIFTAEAKILPTPKRSKKSSRSEHEYVYGKGGGIQRFKEGRHGLDNSDRYLPENGLIAFIKEEHFEFWLIKINQWILDASWNTSEKLQKTYFHSTAKLQSRHNRKDGSFFILHHFWVYVESSEARK